MEQPYQTPWDVHKYPIVGGFDIQWGLIIQHFNIKTSKKSQIMRVAIILKTKSLYGLLKPALGEAKHSD